jgi:proteasome alpha subunit
MGYDRTIAVFSPDGRLFQVEYAKEAVKRGSTALAIVFKEGVVFATIKPVGKLVVSESVEKIYQIDDHVAAVASGLLADARVLIQNSRVRAQVHRMTYDEPIDIWNLGRAIANRMQVLTQYGGLRPFGVSLILAGLDKTGVHLIESDPSGTLFEWKAYAIGRGAALANKMLTQKWKENMTEKEAAALAVDIIEKTEKDKKEGESEIDLVVIKKGNNFKKLTMDEIKSILK